MIASPLAPLRPNPWARVGAPIASPDDPDQALKEAGLAWDVRKVGLATSDGRKVASHVAVRRVDNRSVLGVVGHQYQPLQNRAMLALFRDLAGTGSIRFETAGCFKGGAIVWMLARLEELAIRIGEDETWPYLLISNGHDGNRPVTIAPTNIRVICQNTLAMAEADVRRRQGRGLVAGFTVRHTKGLSPALDDIRDAYARTRTASRRTKEAYVRLAQEPLSEDLIRTVLERAFHGPTGPDESDRSRTIRRKREATIRTLLASPTNQVRGTRDSAFSLLQAVAEYVDHERATRARDTHVDEQRLQSSVMGSGAAIKQRTWEALRAVGT